MSKWTQKQQENARDYIASYPEGTGLRGMGIALIDLACQRNELLEALKYIKREWQHNAPADCYSTGPRTGDLIQDHVACPGCEAQRRVDSAIAKAEGK